MPKLFWKNNKRYIAVSILRSWDLDWMVLV